MLLEIDGTVAQCGTSAASRSPCPLRANPSGLTPWVRIGALAVCGPVDRFRDEIEDHVKALVDVSEHASRALGWDPTSVPA